MFEIGQNVVVNDDGKEIVGTIVYYTYDSYDKKDLWTIKTEYKDRVDQFVFLDCYEKENGILAIW